MSLASWLSSVPGADTTCNYSGLGKLQRQGPSINYIHEPESTPICRTDTEENSAGDAFDRHLNPAQTYTYATPDDSDLPITEPESCDSKQRSESSHHYYDHRQNHHHHHSDHSHSGNGWLGLATASTASLTLGAGAATAACTSRKPMTREEYEELHWYEKVVLRSKRYGLEQFASYLSGVAEEQIPQPVPNEATEQETQDWLSWGGSVAWSTGASIAGTLLDSIYYIRDTVTAASVSAYEMASKRLNRWYALGEESAKISLTGAQTSANSDDEDQAEVTEIVETPKALVGRDSPSD